MTDPQTTETVIMNVEDTDINDIESLIENIALASGVDWDGLSQEQRDTTFQEIRQEIGEFLVDFVGKYGGESDVKHLKIIVASQFKPEIIEKYQSSVAILDQGLRALVLRIITDLEPQSLENNN